MGPTTLVQNSPAGEVEAGAAVVGAAPVVEQGGIAAIAVVQVAGQLEVERAGGKVLEAGVDDVEADLLAGGEPAEGGDLVLIGGVVVLVLGAAFVDAGGQAARFLHVQVVGRVPVLAGDRKSTRLNSSHLGISYAV